MDDLVEEAIDLQATELDQITYSQNRLTLGAMVRLQTIVEEEQAPQLLGETAKREGPNTLRHAATIGGLIAGADWESELLAALLVLEAQVTVQTVAGSQTIALSHFLRNVPANLKGGLVTAVSMATTGKIAGDRVARTPADRPIVAAIGRLDDRGQIHLAFCGVAQTPLLLDPTRLESSLNPPGDFRGSSAYRRQVALTLARRVLATLQNKDEG